MSEVPGAMGRRDLSIAPQADGLKARNSTYGDLVLKRSLPRRLPGPHVLIIGGGLGPDKTTPLRHAGNFTPLAFP